MPHVFSLPPMYAFPISEKEKSHMTTRRPLIFWLAPALLGTLLGVPLGIAAAQNAMETAIPMLLGWLFLPIALAHTTFALPPPDTSVTQVPYWLVLLVVYYYPAAALLTALYSYLTQRYTGSKRPSWRALGLLMGITCVTSLIACYFSPSFNRNGAIFPGDLPFPWVNILISIALGWGLACLVPRTTRQAAL
jgi:hypothetical protein